MIFEPYDQGLIYQKLFEFSSFKSFESQNSRLGEKKERNWTKPIDENFIYLAGIFIPVAAFYSPLWINYLRNKCARLNWSRKKHYWTKF
eukprot:snap_masked-scaffold_57-processed-gene-1.32-mRNA-1 protein AED:1.00 eAED:1.00 QI:0/-1/0/0/-1/1/1/0/88